MNKDTIEVNTQELWRIIIKDSSRFNLVREEMTGNWRHGTEHRGVVEDLSTGKFYELGWRNSVKEGMTLQDMVGDGPHKLKEVEKKVKKVIVYE